MKVLYTFIFLIFLQISLIAQMKSSIELSGCIDYSFRFLFTSRNNSLSKAIISSKNNGEAPSLFYRIGLNYNHLLKRNLFFETGLFYSNLGYHENEQVIYPIECITGSNTFHLDKTLLTQKFSFLEIPLNLRKEFGRQKISSFIECGLSPSIFLRRKYNFQYEDGTIKSETSSDVIGGSRLNLLSSISFGLNYSINKNYQLYSQLSYRLNLTPFTRFQSYEFLYSGGIEMGIRKNLQF